MKAVVESYIFWETLPLYILPYPYYVNDVFGHNQNLQPYLLKNIAQNCIIHCILTVGTLRNPKIAGNQEFSLRI